jgi:UDP-N-acetylmuramoylalanine--D-glutamate ligase
MIEGKKVLVAGFGLTGRAVVEFLNERDCRVTVSESRPASEFPDAAAAFPRVTFEFGRHTAGTFTGADLIVLSPGIPDSIPPVAEAKDHGIPVISEIELAHRYLKGTLIGITGTNGKSTTTELTGRMLQEAGKKATVCGNIGSPLIRYCRNSESSDYYVIELSSFQLETIRDFRPHIAALINLAEDHLDRYPSVDPYYRAKMRIFENQRVSDFAVLNHDDAWLRSHTDGIRSNRFWFSRNEKPPSGVYAQDGIIRTLSGEGVLNFYAGALKGVHNLENSLCAASIGMLCGARPREMQRALDTFVALRHRMEFVAEIGGVSFYDDSKATNVDAVVKSVQSFPGNILLIMGGKDKGCNYEVLRGLITQRVKHLLLIGEAHERMARELSGTAPWEYVETLPKAVERAAALSTAGDVVLLSPACSSFDMFRDYKERGEVFVASVKNLVAG